MKPILFSVVFLTCVFLFSKYYLPNSQFDDLSAEQLSQSLRAHKKVIGQKINPENVLYTLDGKKVSLSEFAGKPLVIMYWAPWCKACKEQLPEMIKAQKQLPETNFVYIVVQSDNEMIEKWQTLETQSMTIYRKGWKQGDSILTGNALPLTYVIDKSGVVLEEQLGFNTSSKLSYIYHRLGDVNTGIQGLPSSATSSIR